MKAKAISGVVTTIALATTIGVTPILLQQQLAYAFRHILIWDFRASVVALSSSFTLNEEYKTEGGGEILVLTVPFIHLVNQIN